MKKISGAEGWRSVLPAALQADAQALLAYLHQVPEMIPTQCPWCSTAAIIQRDPRLYECRDCKRRFTPWTGTPFANCRHQASWEIYAGLRLSGIISGKAGGMAGISHGAAEYREQVIRQLIKARWPSLLQHWDVFSNIPDAEHLPKPLRTTPFTCREEAWAHHNHEYVQCLECGKMFSSLGPHLRKIHGLSALEYREKWQIMKQIPISGHAKRRLHSASIREKIARGDVEPLALAAAMQEASRKNGRKKPFTTTYIAAEHIARLHREQLWTRSPAIKMMDEDIKRQATLRMQQRKRTGEKVQAIADAFGVAKQTLYVWLKRYGSENA